MSNFFMYCIAALTLVSMVACSDSGQSSTTTQPPASMQTDSKDMHPVQH